MILKGARNSAITTTTSYGIIFTNGTTASTTGSYANSNITIDNIEISRVLHGIYANGASSTAAYYNSGISIKNNIIGSNVAAENIGQYAIFLNYSSTVNAPALISNIDISTGDLVGTSGYGLTVAGINLSAGSVKTIIERNHIHDIRQVSTSGWGALGIYISSSTNSDSITIKNNIIRDLTASKYTTSTTSQYTNHGIFVSGEVKELKIINNTIFLRNANENGMVTNYVSSAVYVTTANARIVSLRNNIIINKQVSTAAYCIVLNSLSNLASNSTSNNIYDYPTNLGIINAINYNSLQAWKIATGQETNSINELPTFTSLTNLRIPNNTNTFAESGGVPVSVTGVNNDIDNITRPASGINGFNFNPDIGANEFDGLVTFTCPNPLTVSNTLASKNSICYNEAVTFSLANQIQGTGLAYQWQFSSDNITYNDISNATNESYTGNITQEGYFRLKVICYNGFNTSYSTPILISFINTVVSAPSTYQRCGGGTVNLSATSNNISNIINWYDQTGNTFLASGNTYAPVVLTSSTFKVRASGVGNGNVRVGNGLTSMSTTSFPNPLSAFYGGSKHQIIFTAQELSQNGLFAGNITAISFDVTAFAANTCNDFTIKIGNTSATSLSGFIAATTNTVYNSNFTPNATGLVTFNFSTPFYWNGTDNIIIETIHNSGNSGNGAGTTVAYTPTTSNMVYYHSIDGVTPATAAGFEANLATNPTRGSKGTSLNRPNIVFTGQAACHSSFKNVDVIINTAPAFDITNNITTCNNSIQTISVQSNLINYDQVTWSPINNLFTDAAATIPYVANTHATQVYYKSNIGGLIKYFATAYNSTTSCGAVDSIEIRNLPSTIEAISDKSYVCGSGSSALSLSQNLAAYNVNYQWQSSTDNLNFVNISGATNATYSTPVVNATTYYRAVILNGASACLTSVSDTLNVENPAINSFTNATRCGNGTVTLNASAGNYSVEWYDNITGGNLLFTGNNFTTPILTSTTNYYAQAKSNKIEKINVASPNIGTSTFHTNSVGWGLRFTVNAPVYINSVKIKAVNSSAATATMQINITDLNDVVLYSGVNHSFPITATLTEYTIPVNITIPNNGNYKMVMTSTNITNLVRESSGVTFPYNSPNNAVSITAGANGTGTAQTTTAYYWFYNWVLGEDCISNPRTQVTAIINPIPTVTLNKSGNVGLCSGGSVTLTAGGGTTYT